MENDRVSQKRRRTPLNDLSRWNAQEPRVKERNLTISTIWIYQYRSEYVEVLLLTTHILHYHKKVTDIYYRKKVLDNSLNIGNSLLMRELQCFPNA